MKNIKSQSPAKKSKSQKMQKITKIAYSTQLVPAFVAYRNALVETLNAGGSRIRVSKRYTRIFTDKRAYGARSKFWNIAREFPIKAVKQYIEKHSTFKDHRGVVYEVSCSVDNTVCFRGYTIPSFSLHCTRRSK